jgi:hypothetical protein
MKKKFLHFIILPVVALGITVYGFVSGDILTQKTYPQSQPVENATYGSVLDHSVQAINESFEGTTFPPAGWVRLSPLGNTGWTRTTVGTSPFPGFGTNSVVTGCPGGGSALALVSYVSTQNSEWLITPQITNVQPGDSLTFWMRYWPTIYPDSFRVMISTTTPTVPAMTAGTLMSRGFTGSADSGWIQYKYRIGSTVPAGSNIYIGFHETFTDGSAFCLDLVKYIPAAAPPPPYVWIEQTTPVTGTLASVSAPTDNAVWAAGYTSGTTGPPLVARTTNGGTWTNALGTGIGTALPLYNIWGIDANTALVTGSSSTATFVYKTTNGGTTWTQVFTQAGGFMDGIVMKDASNGVMYGDPVGGRWSLWKTTNGGTNWDSTGMYLPQAGTEAGWNNSMAVIGNNLWFGTNNTRIYYSSNFGSNWVAQPTTGEVGTNGTVVWFNSATNGMLGGATLLTTSNSGANWVSNAGTGTGTYVGITGLGSNWWTVGGAAAIGTSTNNGANWSTAYTTPTGTFVHITTSRTGSGLVYATKSNGQVSKYGVTTGVNPLGGQLVESYSLSQNYPNPFNPSTSISFAIPQSGFVSLKVYNMLGKEVASLVNGNLNAGTHNYSFNASNLASGMYFYKLDVDNFTETKKMIFVK